jgi:S1-C subfamily serine protease
MKLLLLALLLSCSTTGKDGTDGKDGIDSKENYITEALSNTYSKYRGSIYAIYVFCDSFYICNGSGFSIGNNTIATNKHVADCGTCKTTREYCIYAAEEDSDVLNWDVAHCTNQATKSTKKDLAKLKFNRTLTNPAISINDKYVPRVGDLTVSMSYPLDLQELNTTVSAITSNRSADSDYDFVTRNDTDHGSSGSPIFDKDGSCIGLTTAGRDNVNLNVTYAVHCKYLNEF